MLRSEGVGSRLWLELEEVALAGRCGHMPSNINAGLVKPFRRRCDVVEAAVSEDNELDLAGEGYHSNAHC